MRMFNLRSYKNAGVRVQYVRTILMPKFASRVRVQSEVCFGLKVTARYILAATVIYINNQTTKDKFKIILCS